MDIGDWILLVMWKDSGCCQSKSSKPLPTPRSCHPPILSPTSVPNIHVTRSTYIVLVEFSILIHLFISLSTFMLNWLFFNTAGTTNSFIYFSLTFWSFGLFEAFYFSLIEWSSKTMKFKVSMICALVEPWFLIKVKIQRMYMRLLYKPRGMNISNTH